MKTIKVSTYDSGLHICHYTDHDFGLCASAVIPGSLEDAWRWVERIVSGNTCAWCDREDGTVRTNLFGDVSHGICAEHKAKMLMRGRHEQAKE